MIIGANSTYILYGGGGHSKVVQDAIESLGGKVETIFDINNPYNPELYPKSHLIIAIGNNIVREKIAFEVRHQLGVVIHPSAIIAKNVIIGEGTVVLANSVIQSGAIIGKNCIINASTIIDHGAKIEDFCSIYPGAYIGGDARIIRGSTIDPNGVVLRGTVFG